MRPRYIGAGDIKHFEGYACNQDTMILLYVRQKGGYNKPCQGYSD
jgi:hypothetical protein